MTRKSLEHLNCSWAQAAEAIGDKWSLMIIRDAFQGVKTFSAFADNIGIARNILSQRLEHLQKHNILEKCPIEKGSSRFGYGLTEKGKGLFEVVVALGQWGDQWIMGKGKEPFVLVDQKREQPIKRVFVEASDNRKLGIDDVTFKAGPGANEANHLVLETIQRNSAQP